MREFLDREHSMILALYRARPATSPPKDQISFLARALGQLWVADHGEISFGRAASRLLRGTSRHRGETFRVRARRNRESYDSQSPRLLPFRHPNCCSRLEGSGDLSMPPDWRALLEPSAEGHSKRRRAPQCLLREKFAASQILRLASTWCGTDPSRD